MTGGHIVAEFSSMGGPALGRTILIRFLVPAVMLLGLPLIGARLAGQPLSRYLEFPPTTRYVEHAPFSWAAFLAGLVFMAAVTAPFVRRVLRREEAGGERVPEGEGRAARRASARPFRFSFPWWGWAGLAVIAIFWTIAWTRVPRLAPIRPHTFTPLWVGYILTVNALAFQRSGRSLMCDRPRFFLLLFPLSAAFWWFFEYLNRFVQNWYYIGDVDLGPWEYFVRATLPFSTVLPAVLSTRDWLLTFPVFARKFACFRPLPAACSKGAAGLILAAAAAGLAGVGVWPNLLYPLVWVAPLLVIVSVRTLSGERHVLQDVARGDWTLVVTSALAALLCGFFWEMWNYYSLPKWIYAIPYAERFRLFEMPALGYAGYLPFGLACAAVAELFDRER
jgi:hypothetical protein